MYYTFELKYTRTYTTTIHIPDSLPEDIDPYSPIFINMAWANIDLDKSKCTDKFDEEIIKEYTDKEYRERNEGI